MVTHLSFLGFTIAEPMTAFTDLVLALLCFVFFYKFSNGHTMASYFWKLFFLFMACSTLIGGITHAVFEDHQSLQFLFFWLTMQIFSGLSVLFAQLATIHSISIEAIPIYRSTKKSILLCKIQFFIFLAAVLFLHNFLVVVVNSTIGFIMVLYVHALSGSKYGNRSAAFIALGIFISFLTAIIYTLKISMNDWFNFKDIAHVIMMISVCIIFYGVGLSMNHKEDVEPIQT